MKEKKEGCLSLAFLITCVITKEKKKVVSRQPNLFI